MTNIQHPQLFSLLDFIDSRWLPIMGRIENTADGSPAQIVALCQWIDAAGWLRLGLDIEVYEMDAAQRLVAGCRSSVAPLFERYRNMLESYITPLELWTVQQLLSSGTIVSDRHIKSGSAASSYFLTGQAMCEDLDSDELVTLFQKLLLFGDNEAWLEAIKGPISSSAVMRYLEVQDEPEDQVYVEVIVAAMVRCLDSMALWNSLFTELRNNRLMSSGDKSSLERRMGSLNNWRFSLHNTTVERRFHDARNVLLMALRDELLPSLFNFDTEEFADRLDDVIRTWKLNHPFQLSRSMTS